MEPFTHRGLLAGAAALATTAGCLAGDVDDPPTGTGTAPWPENPTWEPPPGRRGTLRSAR